LGTATVWKQHQDRVPAMDAPPTIADFKYRAFIAYSHRDEAWAKWLHKSLESYRLPTHLVGTETAAGVIPRRLGSIFRDRSELPSAPDLSRIVNEALRQSATLIVICSPQSATSHYVNEEITSFKRLDRADRIFCLIVGGEPHASLIAGREAAECFAPALRFFITAEGTPTQERTHPVAADARSGKDGKTNAKLKLIAGMLGIGFDALKQREHTRRMQHMVALTLASLVAMVVTSALAINAVMARKVAVTARQSAERRQKQAEDLVDFMLGDLNDKLGQVQRLDILEATDNQAMRYFQSLPTADVTDQALVLRAKALQKIGSIRTSQGKLPAALESYRAASALAGELARRSPADAARQAAYANSFNWIGNAFWYQGELDKSLDNFQMSINLLEKVSGGSQDTEIASNLASARTNAGRIFEARGDFERARTLYQAVQHTFETLGEREPSNPRWQSELGDAYDNLGKLALEQGQLSQAIVAYQDDQRIKVSLAAKDPKNYDTQENLLISDAILGRTLALRGDRQLSVQYVRDAVQLAAGLATFDPSQTYWREDLGDYSRLLASLLRQNGSIAEAARLDGDAVRILSELVVTDKTNARWRREMAVAQLETARLYCALHDYRHAEMLLQNALPSINSQQTGTPSDLGLILLLADADVLAGQIKHKLADEHAAREYWLKARETIAPVARVSSDPNVLATAASTDLLLDNIELARGALEQLSSMGYRTPDFDAILATKRLPHRGIGMVRRVTKSPTDEDRLKIQ
jgi:tetratricopeptide (TPR) repeat protein